MRGAEFDATARLHRDVSLYGAVAYTDGRYVSFPDAPPPLEETGGPQSKDISGSVLPGISKWALSLGGEIRARPVALRTGRGRLRRRRRQLSIVVLVERELLALPRRRRLPLLNTRIGFRAADGWTVFVWSRNLLDKDYFELLTAAPGNTGLYVGQPGDGRTAGITLRVALKSH